VVLAARRASRLASASSSVGAEERDAGEVALAAWRGAERASEGGGPRAGAGAKSKLKSA
jgi:hypothetical protein